MWWRKYSLFLWWRKYSGKRRHPPPPPNETRPLSRGVPFLVSIIETRCRVRRPEKVAERGGGGGGTPTHFLFPDNFLRHLHYWVGVPSVYQTDLRGDKHKQKKQKKWHSQRGGGGVNPPSVRAWLKRYNKLIRGIT